MRLRFSEEPSEWRKFTWASMAAPVLFAALGAWRGSWGWPAVAVITAIGLMVSLLVAVRPAWFRPWYRAGRRFGHLMGRIMGSVLLTLLWLGVIAPIGIAMRLLRRDPLGLRRDPERATYWIPSRPPGELERMF